MAEFESEISDSVENDISADSFIDDYVPAPPVRTVHIATDENGVITAIAHVGKLSGGFDFMGVIPDDFQVGKYMLHSETVEIDENPETVTEEKYTIINNPDYIEPMPIIDNNFNLINQIEELRIAIKNSVLSNQHAFCKFDGLKYIADPNNPIPLILPMQVIKNMIYLYDGVRYVALDDALLDMDIFSEVMLPYELEE